MSNKFTLSHEDGEVINTMSFTVVHLDQLLENLDRFIKASGFVPKGELEYVEEEPDLIDFEARFINFTYNFEKLLLTELKNIPEDVHEKLYELLKEDSKKYEH